MLKLLLAEDEPALRMLVSDSLEDEGYEIDAACDGEEAVEMIKRGSYDLLILDYMMPKLSGLDVIVQARALPGGDRFKILMLSAKNQLTDRERTAAAGADEFMAKPFSPMALVDKVKEMLHA
jgi:Response regulators consisting of a CheY-like receiver domain and a winged-helix DNA-binding domain